MSAPLLFVFLLALTLSACAGPYEEAREAGFQTAGAKAAPADAKPGAKMAAKKTAGKRKTAAKTTAAGKSDATKRAKKPGEKKPAETAEGKKPDAVGACVSYQFMGGGDCDEAVTKRRCYDKRLNVVDWREGLTCAAAFLSPSPPIKSP